MCEVSDSGLSYKFNGWEVNNLPEPDFLLVKIKMINSHRTHKTPHQPTRPPESVRAGNQYE